MKEQKFLESLKKHSAPPLQSPEARMDFERRVISRLDTPPKKRPLLWLGGLLSTSALLSLALLGEAPRSTEQDWGLKGWVQSDWASPLILAELNPEEPENDWLDDWASLNEPQEAQESPRETLFEGEEEIFPADYLMLALLWEPIEEEE